MSKSDFSCLFNAINTNVWATVIIDPSRRAAIFIHLLLGKTNFISLVVMLFLLLNPPPISTVTRKRRYVPATNVVETVQTTTEPFKFLIFVTNGPIPAANEQWLAGNEATGIDAMEISPKNKLEMITQRRPKKRKKTTTSSTTTTTSPTAGETNCEDAVGFPEAGYETSNNSGKGQESYNVENASSSNNSTLPQRYISLEEVFSIHNAVEKARLNILSKFVAVTDVAATTTTTEKTPSYQASPSAESGLFFTVGIFFCHSKVC